MQCSKTKEQFLFQRIRELIRLLYQEAFQRGLSLGLKKGRIEGMITYQSRIIQNLERDNVEITKMMDSVDAEIKRGY